ncbi:MAG: SatD family protein [Actinomycetota bacterium]|nr:SatD family protein [Actinomycetota bacterium]
MTIDQRGSRHDVDRVEELLTELAAHVRHPNGGLRLPFERTAGDEVQGVITDPILLVDITLRCTRAGHWAVGIGLGAIRTPIPDSTRRASGPAFENARDAVNRAKKTPEAVAVKGMQATSSRYAEAVLCTLATLLHRRSAAGWQAVDLIMQGRTQTQIAEVLGVSKQAVSQRLHAAWWWHEQSLRPVAGHLLTEAAS